MALRIPHARCVEPVLRQLEEVREASADPGERMRIYVRSRLEVVSRHQDLFTVTWHERAVLGSTSFGQLAAVESGLAVAVTTRCSVPAHLQILQNLPAEFDLPALVPMEVALLRSKASARSAAVDAMYEQMLRTLSGGGGREPVG